jgi:hypothetical protein
MVVKLCLSDLKRSTDLSVCESESECVRVRTEL